VRRTAIFIALAATISASSLALAAPGRAAPPYFPSAHKKYSGTVHGLALRMLGGLVIRDGRCEDTVRYLEDLPGDLKAAKLSLRGEPRPTPRDVHDFYLGWAAQEGFRLLFESRMPTRPVEGRVAYGEGEVGYTDLFHQPGPGGGLLLIQAKDGDILWMWQAGHVPVGPIAAIWLGLPKVKPDMTAPEGPQPWSERPDLPSVDPERFDLRL
jgi:hypothetical protein